MNAGSRKHQSLSQGQDHTRFRRRQPELAGKAFLVVVLVVVVIVVVVVVVIVIVVVVVVVVVVVIGSDTATRPPRRPRS